MGLSTNDSDFAREFDRINGKHISMYSGVVTAWDADTLTCSVRRTIDDEDAPLEGVTVNLVMNNGTGLYCVPKVGAACLVAKVDDSAGYELFRAAEYSLVTGGVGGYGIRISETQVGIYNGGGNFVELSDNKVILRNAGSGVPYSYAVADWLYAVISEINTLKALLNSWVPVGGDGGAALKTLITGAGWGTTPLPDISTNDIANPDVLI